MSKKDEMVKVVIESGQGCKENIFEGKRSEAEMMFVEELVLGYFVCPISGFYYHIEIEEL